MPGDKFPTIRVLDQRATSRLGKLHENARAGLRIVLATIARDLSGRIAERLVPGVIFKTTDHLKVSAKLTETRTGVAASVAVQWTGDPRAAMVPWVLESGSRPHEIAARNARSLYFYWEKLGMNVAFKRVWHPGYPGAHFMEGVWNERMSDYHDQLVQSLRLFIQHGGSQ